MELNGVSFSTLLILPILNYGSEVWGFSQANAIERVHLQFCKRLLGVKKTTQNDFIYGELGRTTCITKRYLLIIKYWFKILYCGNTKYIKLVYNMMLNDKAECSCYDQMYDVLQSNNFV